MASENDLEMGEQPVQVKQRHQRERIAAISVNGLCVMGPSPFSRASLRLEQAPAKRSVTSTHSRPNAQPPITSLGQWTPSITRLAPMSSDRRIAPDGGRLLPARPRGQRQGQGQVEDHRAGRVAARERRGLHDHQMRLEVGPDARDPIFLQLAQRRPDQDDREQDPASVPVPAHHSQSAPRRTRADQNRRARRAQ